MLTSRDHRIIRFISSFSCVTTSQLHKLFFPDVSVRRCQQRLNELTRGKLNRTRSVVSSDYIYYINDKPSQVEHMLTRVDAYIDLSTNYRLSEFVPEYSLCDLRADAYFEIWRNGYTYPYFLEVQRSPYFRQNKYEKVYNGGAWLDKWEEFPPVIVVSDNKIRYRPSNIKYIQTSQAQPIVL